MAIIDILKSPWMILPDRLNEIWQIYDRHAKGEKANLSEIEAAMGKPLQNDAPEMEIRQRKAIIPVQGTLVKRYAGFMQDVSGLKGMEQLGRMVDAAANDPTVDGIILNIDSPGGTVDGTHAFYEKILSARERKPVVAVIDGSGYSAAYYVASAADAIYLSDKASGAGSIGIAYQHVDQSKADDMEGRKVREIYAGKYKRIASSHAPLTPEGEAFLQDQIDEYYSIFVDAVATGRGVSAEKVLSDMADARIFIGNQAIKAGLADGIKSLDEVVSSWNRLKPVKEKKKMSATDETVTPVAQPSAADIEKMRAEIEAKIKADYQAEIAALKAEQAAERALNAQCLADLAAAKELKASGKLPPVAFKQIFGEDEANPVEAYKTALDQASANPVGFALDIIKASTVVPAPEAGRKADVVQLLPRTSVRAAQTDNDAVVDELVENFQPRSRM